MSANGLGTVAGPKEHKPLPPAGSLGAWMLAIRPKTLSAGVVPVVVGGAMAERFYLEHAWVQAFAFWQPWARLGAALLVALGIQVGTNLVNDVADHFKGADTHERLGPPRVTSLGLLTPRVVIAGAIACFVVAAAAGLWLLTTLANVGADIRLALILGAISLVCGVLYTVGPVSIAYLGLGEVFVFGFFGLFATAGTTFAVTGFWDRSSVVAGAAFGCLAMGLLETNNIRDIETDAPVGKKTLAVRLGDHRARVMYAGVIASAFVFGALVVPWWGAIVLVAVSGPIAWRTVKPVLDGASGRDLIPVLQRNSIMEVWFGACLTVILLIAPVTRVWTIR